MATSKSREEYRSIESGKNSRKISIKERVEEGSFIGKEINSLELPTTWVLVTRHRDTYQRRR